MAEAVSEVQAAPSAKKKVGPVTTAATGGSVGLAAALGTITVWLLSVAGVDVPDEVAVAVTAVWAAVGALVGGWLAPSKEHLVADAVASYAPSQEQVAATVHGALAAHTAASEVPAESEPEPVVVGEAEPVVVWESEETSE